MSDEWKQNMTSLNFDFEDMFYNQNERTYGSIEEIKITDMIPFQQHTFKVLDDEEMERLVESIKNNGILVPGIAFWNENRQLELVSGHRRRRACELAEIETMPIVVRKMTRDEAIIVMGETNLKSREKILPSEKAWTYRYMNDAMKRQGKRTNITSSQVGTKLRTDEILSEKFGVSRNQIQRYIRLTYLIPELLQLVDLGVMAISPAVEISYIDSIYQQYIYSYYDTNLVTPSHSQAISMKELARKHSLDEIVISEMLEEEKPNQKPKFVLKNEKVLSYKGELKDDEFENKVLKALEFYDKYKDRINDRGYVERE